MQKNRPFLSVFLNNDAYPLASWVAGPGTLSLPIFVLYILLYWQWHGVFYDRYLTRCIGNCVCTSKTWGVKKKFNIKKHLSFNIYALPSPLLPHSPRRPPFLLPFSVLYGPRAGVRGRSIYRSHVEMKETPGGDRVYWLQEGGGGGLTRGHMSIFFKLPCQLSLFFEMVSCLVSNLMNGLSHVDGIFSHVDRLHVACKF